MSAPEVAARKEALRKQARRLPREGRAERARAACARLLALPELAAARTVALYAAIQDEVPVDAAFDALRERGLRTAAPRVVDRDDLELIELGEPGAKGTRWKLGHRGIREPASGSALDASAVDLFVVPGLLFDRSGRRLGRGGGHYDRLLARARPDAPRVGICYADRVVDALPDADWDQSMDVVVTDAELIRGSRRGTASGSPAGRGTRGEA